MLDPKRSNEIAAANEAAVAKQFTKLGYLVERLDRKSSKRARPDFLISDAAGCPHMLCEVKTVLSAGYLPDRHAHVSMQDEGLCDTGVFSTTIDLRDIEECLASAVRKRAALISDEPRFADLPLLVAFSFDFYADFLHCYPRRMDENISGILTIEANIAQQKVIDKFSHEELERRCRDGDESGLPPPSEDFVLVRNKAAARTVPEHFQLCCQTEGYDESL